MSEKSSGAIAPLTPEEFAKLQAGDTVGRTGEQSGRRVIARDPQDPGIVWLTRFGGVGWPMEAREGCRHFPTGETLARLRPEPQEIREGQTWRDRVQGVNMVTGALGAHCPNRWSLYFHGELWACLTEEQLRYTNEFVSEPPSLPTPTEIEEGEKWIHRVSRAEFTVDCAIDGENVALRSPNRQQVLWMTEESLRRDYEKVDPAADDESEDVTMDGLGAMLSAGLMEGETKLAAAVATTDPDLIWRVGWWYFEKLEGKWWRIVTAGIFAYRIERSRILSDGKVLRIHTELLRSEMAEFFDPASGQSAKPEGA